MESKLAMSDRIVGSSIVIHHTGKLPRAGGKSTRSRTAARRHEAAGVREPCMRKCVYTKPPAEEKYSSWTVRGSVEYAM
eukprot:6177541-Pleurochrysis_carterae.AAC.1